MQHHFEFGNGAFAVAVGGQSVAIAFGEAEEVSLGVDGLGGAAVEAESLLYLLRDAIVRPPADIVVLIGEHGCVDIVVEFDERLLGLPLPPKELPVGLQLPLPPCQLVQFVGEQLRPHLLDEAGTITVPFSHIIQNKSQSRILKFYYPWGGGGGGRGERGIIVRGVRLYFNCLGVNMQSSPRNNLLRNSYGYQIVDPPPLRSPTAKAFLMPAHQNTASQSSSTASSIRQLENKLEGLAAKKLTQAETNRQDQQPLQAGLEGQARMRGLPFAQNEPLSEGLLRGSCQNVMQKFDYNVLRNTTHFNPLSKPPPTHNELRRSPGAQDPQRHPQANRTLAQEPSNVFLRPAEKKLLENKHSFLANHPSRSPLPPEEKSLGGSRTPTKYNSLFFDSLEAKTHKAPHEPQEDKKLFKSLNEIVENKQKAQGEKALGKGQFSGGKRSTTVNGFQLGSILGRGKFGEVFLGRHSETGFIAAIKKIEKAKVRQLKMVDQFAQEIRLHSCLDHPNIVKFFGVFDQGDHVYLVMEFLNGGTLFDCLNEVSSLPLRDAVDYLQNVIEALTYMHDKSIAHRDIKPENIVISSEGVAKLCDFGWSALVETSRRTYCGTFDYAPPEILERKNYDTSVDIWCIGVLTFELLTGRVPFQGDQRNIVRDKILNVDKHSFEFPANFPAEAKEFIECLVQKDPALRPKCHELLKFRLFTMHSKNKSKKT